MAQQSRNGNGDDSAMAIIQPSLKVGAAFGTVGFLYGGTRGTLTGTTPLIFATASGIRSLVLGTSLWATRGAIIQAWTVDGEIPKESLKASSAIAGGLAGGFTAIVTRGRSSAIPQAIVWSLLGYVGQLGYDKLSAPRAATEGNFWRRMADKKWSPITYMSDEEYADVLRGKLLRVDADISILDDKIAALRKESLKEPDNAPTNMDNR